MRVWVPLLIALLFLPSVGLAQAPRRYERALKRNSDVKYLVHVPQNYNPKRAYPLFIAVHHKGGPAIDQYNQWNDLTSRDHYILLCPQFFGGYEFFISDEDEKLIAMIRELKGEFRYDPERVYMAGYSVGGDFVQRFTFEHPGIVAAAAILNARNFLKPPYSGKARETRYLVTAGADDTGHLGMTKDFVESMRKSGYMVQYREFPGLGKDINNAVKSTAMDFFKKIK